MLVVLVSGLALGSLYSLVSMGLTLTFSTLRVFNFSHGATITVGGYVAFYFLSRLGLGYPIAFILTVPICFLLGALLQRVVLKPLVAKGEMPLILGTLGVALVLENVLLLVFGGRLKRLPVPIEGAIKIGQSTLSSSNLLIFICSLVLLVLMSIVLKKTRFGMATRAVAQDLEASRVVGIAARRVNMYVFGASVALAGISGVFLASIYFLTPSMGTEAMTKAFIICVLGGLGSVPGTIAAAYIVGLLEATIAMAIGIYWSPVVLFSFMMAVLIIRPAGLFGGGMSTE